MEKPIDFWFRTGKAGGEPKPTEIALRTSMSLERSRKTQSVSEGAERAREPSTDKKIAISQEFGDFFLCISEIICNFAGDFTTLEI
jgi:hypothetical protein